MDYNRYFAETSGTEIWELWLLAGKTSFVVEQCIATTEPAFAAKHAFQLAQQFNNFYHRHHILTEADEGRKKFLLATAAVVRRELIRCAGRDGNHRATGDVGRPRSRRLGSGTLRMRNTLTAELKPFSTTCYTQCLRWRIDRCRYGRR